MKKLKFVTLLLAVLLPFLNSCTQKTPLQKLIHDADVVKVFIYSPSGNTIVHYETNDIEKINQWTGFIDESSKVAGSCDYEGKLIFKAYEDSTIMIFSLKVGCRQVAYTINDTSFVKSLTPQGISFLDGLKKIQ